MPDETKNQFSLTHAALSTYRCAKCKFLSVAPCHQMRTVNEQSGLDYIEAVRLGCLVVGLIAIWGTIHQPQRRKRI